jgi:peptidoglycan/LPS O-acetylase OafA/YrhL
VLVLLMAVAGLHYLLGSRAARRLESVEAPSANLLRRRLRRLNGGIILLLATAMAAGFYAFDLRRAGLLFLLDWLLVVLLMATMLVLVVADLRLTHQLRKEFARKWQP